jgi:N-acetylglutamate synthase-like GNAT family acetyltransferase
VSAIAVRQRLQTLLTLQDDMTAQLVTIEKASPECLDDVLEILSRVNLPRDGVKERFGGFLIARSGGGKILGCVGLERHGELGLLHSAAVLPEYQGQWIGNKLVLELLKQAASEDVTEVVLLTTTAKEYFQNMFGFKEATRSDYEKRLANCRRRLHHRRLLVHSLDFVREPRGDARALFQQYIRRYPPGGCSGLYLGATYRRDNGDTSVPPACARAAQERAGGHNPVGQIFSPDRFVRL